MGKLQKNKTFLILLLLIVSALVTPIVFGADFEVEFPAVGPDGVTPEKSGGPIVWVNYIFLFGVSLSGIAAVGSLIYAGILWMTSESTGKIQEARARIWAAILGIIIVAGSVIILRTINPDLVNLTQPNVDNTIFYQTYEYNELCAFDEYHNSLANRCEARGEEGDECVVSIQCLSNSCVDGACTENNVVGQSCSPIDTQGGCPGDQYCGPTSKCIIKGENKDASCTNDIQCLSGECDLNTNTCKRGKDESCTIVPADNCARNYNCRTNYVNGTCQ